MPELVARPGVTVPVLGILRGGASEYVRRSIANHLHDLSCDAALPLGLLYFARFQAGRDAADLAVATSRRGLDVRALTTGRLVRYGLGTLVIRGHHGVLELLGLVPATFEIDGSALDRAGVPFGGGVRFTATIGSAGAG